MTSCARRFVVETFRTIARREDAIAVERLVRLCGIFNPAEVAIARELVEENLAKGEQASGYYFLFADGAGGIDGYSCYGPVPGTKGRFEIYWIAVSPTARRAGLGRRLEEATAAKVRAMGGVYLIAETSTLPAYAAARGFYLARGFKAIAEVPDWHDDGDGLAIFGKRL
jgi:ribosomal protein S18 acetylase RimI-like enzyme